MGLNRRMGNVAAAWLLSLALCLGSVGDLLTSSLTLQGAADFASEICHAPGSSQQDKDDQAPRRAAHDCCVACHAAQNHPLVPPEITVIGRVEPATGVVFPPDILGTRPNPPSFHKNARAPPSA